MKNVYIYCEGPTEESFINEILYPYFFNLNIIVRPIICATKRTPTQKFKGGVSDYGKIKKELTMLCKSHPNEYVTTMFDYYAMPDNTPGIDCNDPNLQNRIHQIEAIILRQSSILISASLIASFTLRCTNLRGYCSLNLEQFSK